MFAELIGKAIGAFGDKPDVPGFRKINPQQEQKKATLGNLNNLGSIQDLVGATNAFNQDQLQKSLEKAVPGYGGIKDAAGKSLLSQMRGEIPEDVQRQIQDNAAAKSIAGGFGGGGMHRNLVARDLGLTSLQITNQAIDSASRWIGNQARMEMGGQMTAQSMFISPMQQFAAEQGERNAEFQRDWTQSQIDAMPSPGLAAIGQGLMGFEKWFMDSVQKMIPGQE